MTKERIKKTVVSIHNGIFLTIRMTDAMSFAGKWIQLEIIILRELSQSQKDKYLVFFSHLWFLDVIDTQNQYVVMT